MLNTISDSTGNSYERRPPKRRSITLQVYPITNDQNRCRHSSVSLASYLLAGWLAGWPVVVYRRIANEVHPSNEHDDLLLLLEYDVPKYNHIHVNIWQAEIGSFVFVLFRYLNDVFELLPLCLRYRLVGWLYG